MLKSTIIFIFLLCPVFIVACGGNSSNDIDSNSFKRGLSGAPIPTIAYLEDSYDPVKDGCEGCSKDPSETYLVEKPLPSVERWYRRILPKGKRLSEWDWCGMTSMTWRGMNMTLCLFVSQDRRRILNISAAQDGYGPKPYEKFRENRTSISIEVSDQLSQLNCDGFTIDSRMGR